MKGILSTSVVGVFFAVLFVSLGSLVPVQVIHTVVDVGGMLMGAILLARVTAATPAA